jgi:hypothetical protein
MGAFGSQCFCGRSGGPFSRRGLNRNHTGPVGPAGPIGKQHVSPAGRPPHLSATVPGLHGTVSTPVPLAASPVVPPLPSSGSSSSAWLSSCGPASWAGHTPAQGSTPLSLHDPYLVHAKVGRVRAASFRREKHQPMPFCERPTELSSLPWSLLALQSRAAGQATAVKSPNKLCGDRPSDRRTEPP